MTRLLKHAHLHVPGNQDDILYVILSFLVVTVRWARAHAWRAPPPEEKTAVTRFCRELGPRMDFTGIPRTFSAAEKGFDRYERDNNVRSPAGAQLMASTVQVLKSRLPGPATSLTRPILAAMLDDEHLTDARGLPLGNAITCCETRR